LIEICFEFQHPEDFLKKPDDEHESVDMHTAMTSVGNVLEVYVLFKLIQCSISSFVRMHRPRFKT
jgi:hypothetical protein